VTGWSSSAQSSPSAVPASPQVSLSPEGLASSPVTVPSPIPSPVAAPVFSQKRGRGSMDDHHLNGWLSSIESSVNFPSAISQEFVVGMNALMTKFEDEPDCYDRYAPALTQCYPYFKKMKQCVSEHHADLSQNLEELFDFPTDYDHMDMLNAHHTWETHPGATVVEETPVFMAHLVSTAPPTYSSPSSSVNFGGQPHPNQSDDEEDTDNEGDDTGVEREVLEYSDDYCTDDSDDETTQDEGSEGHSSEDNGDHMTAMLGRMSLKQEQAKRPRTIKDLLQALDTLVQLGEKNQQTA